MGLSALLLGSCGKETAGRPGGSVRVTFVVQAPSLTKGAMASGGETAIHSLDLIVFRADGVLENYVRTTAGSTVTTSLITGEELTYYVVANLPAGRLTTVANESSFLSTMTYMTDMSLNSMVMSGSGTVTLTGGGQEEEVGPVGLDRYACKVSITDITMDWLSDFVTKPVCVVNRVLVMNGRTAVPLSGTATDTADTYWINKLTDEALDADPASIIGALAYENLNVALPSDQTVALGSVVYAMPNSSTSEEIASDVPWAPRQTRVCLEVLVDGSPNWYSIPLPVMVRNTHYIVSDLVLTGPGTLEPDMGIDRTAVSFGVSVEPWVDTTVEAGEFPLYNQ